MFRQIVALLGDWLSLIFGLGGRPGPGARKWERDMAELRAAAGAAPDDADAALAVARHLAHKRGCADTLGWFERAAACPSAGPEHLYQLAINLHDENGALPDRAWDLFDRAVESGDAPAHIVHDYVFELGRSPRADASSRAEELLRGLLGRTEDRPEASLELAEMIGHDPARRPEAKELLKAALEGTFVRSFSYGRAALLLGRDDAHAELVDQAFTKSLAAAPEDEWVRAAYARFLAHSPTRIDEALEHLHQIHDPDMDTGAGTALNMAAAYLMCGDLLGAGLLFFPRLKSLPERVYPTLVLDAAFLAYAWRVERLEETALARIRAALTVVGRPWWNRYDAHIDEARRIEHPEMEWLEPLARVIRGDASPDVLEGWASWTEAG